jgi:hypothetical protein
LQCRGSIPLLWTQLPNIKYKPPTKLRDDSVASSAFDTHFDALLQQYNVSHMGKEGVGSMHMIGRQQGKTAGREPMI